MSDQQAPTNHFDSEQNRWRERGFTQAQAEFEQGYTTAFTPASAVAVLRERYDAEHDDYRQRRDACLQSYLFAYTEQWTRIHELRAAVRQGADALAKKDKRS